MPPRVRIEPVSCSGCGEEKPPGDFSAKSRKCKPCVAARVRAWYGANRQQAIASARINTANWRQRDPRAYDRSQKASRLRREYGLSLDDWCLLREVQEFRCAICRLPGRGLVVDHCHITGSVRGLLCDNCNKGIGFFADDPILVARALNHLGRNAS